MVICRWLWAGAYGCTMKGCDWTGSDGEMDLHLQSCKTRSADQRQELGKPDYSERTVICDSCQSPYIARESESHKSNCQFDKPITIEIGGGKVTLYRQSDSVGPFYQEQDTDTTKPYSKVYVATTASHLKRLSSPAYRILPANAQCTLGGENCSVQEFRKPSHGHGMLDWYFGFFRQSSNTHNFDFRMALQEQNTIVKHFYSYPEFQQVNYIPEFSISDKTHAFAGLRVDFYRSGKSFRHIFHLKNIEDNRPDRLYLMEIVNHT